MSAQNARARLKLLPHPLNALLRLRVLLAVLLLENVRGALHVPAPRARVNLLRALQANANHAAAPRTRATATHLHAILGRPILW